VTAAGRGWRLILGAGTDDLQAASGALNMAVDQALLESVQEGSRPALRLYLWQPACLSFGRNQLARGLYDPARARAAGIEIVRRPTGGLAVLHDQELTYSVAAPLRLFGGPRAAYAAINRALVDGLRTLGVPAALAPTGPRREPFAAAAEPCFYAAATGEVVAHGHKLVGSAQRAERGTLLQHGSILLDGTQADVLRLLVVPEGAERPRKPSFNGAAPASGAGAGGGSITLRELLGSVPSRDALVRGIMAGFLGLCGTRLAPETLARGEGARVAVLEDHYRAATWTWRR
jgi:lipoyl(octanoyl) transferase